MKLIKYLIFSLIIITLVGSSRLPFLDEDDSDDLDNIFDNSLDDDDDVFDDVFHRINSNINILRYDNLNNTLRDDNLNNTLRDDNLNNTLRDDNLNNTLRDDNLNNTLRDDNLNNNNINITVRDDINELLYKLKGDLANYNNNNYNEIIELLHNYINYYESRIKLDNFLDSDVDNVLKDLVDIYIDCYDIRNETIFINNVFHNPNYSFKRKRSILSDKYNNYKNLIKNLNKTDKVDVYEFKNLSYGFINKNIENTINVKVNRHDKFKDFPLSILILTAVKNDTVKTATTDTTNSNETNISTNTYYVDNISTTTTNRSLPTLISNHDCGIKSNVIYVCKNNQCCGENGRCGTTDTYCGTGCNPNFGKCW